MAYILSSSGCLLCPLHEVNLTTLSGDVCNMRDGHVLELVARMAVVTVLAVGVAC